MEGGKRALRVEKQAKTVPRAWPVELVKVNRLSLHSEVVTVMTVVDDWICRVTVNSPMLPLTRSTNYLKQDNRL